MKDIDKFNLKRCAYIIAQDFEFNRKRNTLYAIACIVAMQLPLTMMLYYDYQCSKIDAPEFFFLRCYDIYYNALGSLIYFGLLTMAASDFASSLRNKKKNYIFLMQPSTVLEKITANLVVKGLCAYLILELSILFEIVTFQLVKETLNVNTALIATRNIIGETPNVRSLITNDYDSTLIVVCNIAAVFSAYCLGSTLWKKGAWIKTSIAIATFVFIVLNTEIYQNLFHDDDIVNIATIIFTIVAWFIIYHIIKRKQIA